MLKICSYVGKVAAFIAGLSVYADVIPPKYAGAAALVFMAASLIKDTANRAGDIADNGKEDGSFTAGSVGPVSLTIANGPTVREVEVLAREVLARRAK
ncbi:hypothetical protein DB346_07105 [Verrucomicrobia bacterium LW23]|nr:hypothetical protein DB346_07105 [Verrucomicrobia bacterium LW23]